MARLAYIQAMGERVAMRKKGNGGATDDNYGAGFHSSSTNQRRSSWAQTEKTLESGDSRSLIEGDNASVERLREAVNRSSTGGRWQEIAIVTGSVLLVACVTMTLLLASGINARANRIITENATRSTADEAAVMRLEGKLDENRKAIEGLATTTSSTTTTTAPARRATATTRPPARQAPTTARPAPPAPPTTATTRPPAPPVPTTKPCQFALLNLCVLA